MNTNKSIKFGLIVLLFVSVLGMTGCTENLRARHWGGTTKMTLEPGRKLVNVTFKEADFWILTRAAKPGEQPETFEFVENSNFGMMNGKVIISER